MVSYFFSWQKLPEDMWPHFAAEFRDNGADGIVLSHACAVRLLDEPDFAGKLHELSRVSGLGFSGAHALFGPEWDLSAIDDEHLRKQEKILRMLPEFGVKTSTFHIGLIRGTLEESRAHALAALKYLVSCAEECGVTICIENAEHPGGACEELLYYRGHIPSPALGFCFDSGHANVNGGEIPVLEKMLPDIVVCHLHDNPGNLDLHMVPGEGNIPWNEVLALLRTAPRLVSLENEANVLCSNWSYRKAAEIFKKFDEEVFGSR